MRTINERMASTATGVHIVRQDVVMEITARIAIIARARTCSSF